MDNFIKENNIKIFDILDSVNLAIWIIEYSEKKIYINFMEIKHYIELWA